MNSLFIRSGYTLSLLALLGTCLLLLTGCSSLNMAGSADYSISPIVQSDGSKVCCAVSIKNGKEIALLKAHVEKRGDDYTVDLEEQNIAALQGQKIAADALTTTVDAAVRASIGAALAPIAPLILR